MAGTCTYAPQQSPAGFCRKRSASDGIAAWGHNGPADWAPPATGSSASVPDDFHRIARALTGNSSVLEHATSASLQSPGSDSAASAERFE